MAFIVGLELAFIQYSRYCALEAREWPDLRPVSFRDFVEASTTMDEKLKLAIKNATLPFK